MTTINFPSVLTIAGSDSSGGAGIQADLKTFSALGCYGASVITAITAQNTCAVEAIYPLPSDIVAKQITAVLNDLTIDTIKIGMLHNIDIITGVSRTLKQFKLKNIVFDPVMIAKDGTSLLSADSIQSLKNHFLTTCTLMTPNIPEAQQLLSSTIQSRDEMALAAAQMGLQYKTNVLIKGGHLLSDASSDDVLYSYQDKTISWFESPRLTTQNTHGTGCTLSSAIAAYLARNYPLPEAITAAKQYVTKAIASAATLQIGKGHGPLNHFYFLENARIKRDT